MQDGEIQRELLKETREAKKALEVAINIEMGIQTQLKISGTPTTNCEETSVWISILSSLIGYILPIPRL